MKINKIALIIVVAFLIGGCAEKSGNRAFIIEDENPAVALTIGWYAPVDVLKAIVGPNFKPKVVNDKNESSIMLFIVKSDEHIVDGSGLGEMEAAHLIIPVEGLGDITTADGVKIENSIVCPLTIVDQSEKLGDKYKEFGFSTYSGEIDLNVNKTESKYMVDARIKTVNGLIEINGMFEGEGKSHDLSSAIFSTNPEMVSYFYGDETMTRISDGKGNLKTDGQNVISAMNLSGHPYFLKLDVDFTWEFDFASVKY